ncbi:MAG: hypothetical protein WC570_01260 [Patescibacteria group bacterium]
MLLHSTRYEIILRILRSTIIEIFKVALVTYLLLYLLNDTFPGFVTDNLRIIPLLWITLITGMLSIWIGPEKSTDNSSVQQIRFKEYIFISVLSLASIAFIYYRIQAVGKLAYMISILSGLIIFLLSILLINEQNNDDEIDKV